MVVGVVVAEGGVEEVGVKRVGSGDGGGGGLAH